jgi:hypothetical protein
MIGMAGGVAFKYNSIHHSSFFVQMIQQSNDIAIAGITGLNGATEKK